MSQTTTREERRSALDDFAATMAQPVEASQLPTVVQPHAVAVQPATPLAPPRDEAKILRRLAALAAAAGENYYYSYPVTDRKTGRKSYIEGASKKLTNDVAREYGNCDVDCRYEDLVSHWVFYARFVDRETGFSLTRPYRARATASKIGGHDDDRRADGAFAIGVSKAERNVIANALQTLVDFTFQEAKASMVEKVGKNLERYRQKVVGMILDRGISIRRVDAVIGRPSGSWLAPDISRVIAMMNAIEDGMASIDDTFPPLEPVEADERRQFNEFAASPPNPAEAAADGAGSPAPHDPVTTTGGEPPQPPPPVGTYKEAITKILGVATDKRVDPDDRVANLDGPVRDMWMAALPDDPEFVIAALRWATEVAQGDRTAAEARRMMEARLP